MHPIRVIPSKRWQHKVTKRTASVYGACPYTGVAGDQREDWEIVQVGWTVENDDGTVGIGRTPWATQEAAQAYLDRNRLQSVHLTPEFQSSLKRKP